MTSSSQRICKYIPETSLELDSRVPDFHRSRSPSHKSIRSLTTSEDLHNKSLGTSSRPSSASKSELISSSHEDDKGSNVSQDAGWGFCSKHIDNFSIVQWLQRFSHHNENLVLRNEDEQRIFFCLVMSAKFGQLLFILINILIPTYSMTVRDFLHTNHNYWVSLPFCCAFITGTIVRIFPVFQTLRRGFHIVLFLFVTICYAYTMGSLSASYNNLIVEKVFLLLTTTAFFLTVFVFTVTIFVVKKMVYIAATSSVIFFATTMALLPSIFQADPSFEISIDVWIPAVVSTEILIFLLIFEMQSFLAGDHIGVTRKDWLYLALYL